MLYYLLDIRAWGAKLWRGRLHWGHEWVGKCCIRTLIIFNTLLHLLLLFFLAPSRPEGLGGYGFFKIISALFLLHHLLIKFLLHIAISAGLLCGKGLVGDLHASRLHLTRGLWQALEDLIG